MDMNNLKQYETVSRHFMKELNCEGILLRHKKSGARLFLIPNDDNNKVFNIAFRTVPEDSTGVPHIIEHTVLCGSDKYPAKDPFIELAKGSVNTFLNAMTYPDKTMYPVASPNDRDFSNLMSVYMDAVFHPNITKTEYIFRQEGWHYELEDKDAELICNGVVYNEMKGALSSTDDVLECGTNAALFPDTTYGVVSGGDPEYIPNLTYEAYLAFYRRYYHPSNSYIYLYGDMDMEKVLTWMDQEYLSHYDRIDPKSEIKKQAPFDTVKDVTIPYSVTEEEAEDAGNYFSWNKVVGDTLDQKTCLAFEILETVLMEAPGAPLKRALQEKNIGTEIYGGFEDNIFQTMFNVTAKDASADQKELFVSTIKETLETLVKDGLNRRSLQAALNSLEFRLRESDFGRWPKGLMLGLQCFSTWLYDENDPFSSLEYEEALTFLRENIETGYFEDLIRTKLLENTFGVMVTAKPKVGLTEEKDEKQVEKLQAYKNSLSEEELEELVRETKALRKYQETPTAPEVLEMIPMLQISDLDRNAAKICNDERSMDDVPVLLHPLFTAGIGYLDLVFDADFLSAEEAMYLPLLKMFYGSVNTEQYSYRDLSDEINIYTGGVSTDYMVAGNTDSSKQEKLYFVLHTKALYENMTKAMELGGEMLLHSDFSDDKRLKEIIGESRSRLKEMLQGSGHTTAARRAGSYLSRVAYLNDLTGGIGAYDRLDDLYRNFDEKKEGLRAGLKRVIDRLFVRERLLVSLTADEEGYQALKPALDRILPELAQGECENGIREIVLEKKNEGICCASQVQYVARGGNFKKTGLPYTGSLQVLKNILNYEYLWKSLREKGGAYGCMSDFGRNGTGYFVSYRDPHVRRTNEVYEKLPEYVASFDASERDMAKYVIGIIGEKDVPLTASGKGIRGLNAYLTGITEEDLQKERNEILDTRQADIRALKPYMEAILKDDCLCTIGNSAKLKEDQELFGCLRQL